MLESYADQKERDTKIREAKLKDEVSMLFNQALQIGNIFGHMMSKDVPIKELEEYYPDLFSTEKEIFTEQENGDELKASQEMELHKARMDDFIFWHNRAMRERLAKERGESSGRNDTREAASDNRGTD